MSIIIKVNLIKGNPTLVECWMGKVLQFKGEDKPRFVYDHKAPVYFILPEGVQYKDTVLYKTLDEVTLVKAELANPEESEVEANDIFATTK